jgi:hypothetical protein
LVVAVPQASFPAKDLGRQALMRLPYPNLCRIFLMQQCGQKVRSTLIPVFSSR